jgi:predicted protein tyrosine phosphatase
MLVRVSSLALAEEQAKDWATFVVSLVDPELEELPNFQANFTMSIVMRDVEVISDAWSPKFEDIVGVFQLVQPQDHVLVHCHGGISRSTALGIGLLISDGVSITNAVHQVHQMRPNLAPNKLILQHIDRHLNLGGTLNKQVQDVLDTLPKDLWLWCHDCQLHFKDADGHDCPTGGWISESKIIIAGS